MEAKKQQELVSRVLTGDKEAFGPLMLANHAGIRAYLAVRLDDPHEADDLAQEVFLTAFSRLHTFDPSRPMGAWLRGIAMNLLHTYRRERRDLAVGGVEELDDLIHWRIEKREEEQPAQRMLNALSKCRSSLGEKARQVLRWRYEERLGMAEVARRLGRKHSAATMMLHRLRNQLKLCIEKQLAEDNGDD